MTTKQGINNNYNASLFYAIKSIKRNFRRSFTLMLGVIISLAIVSGVLFYLDSTSGTMVEKAVDDVEIDISIMDTQASETYIRELKDFTLTEISTDLIVGAEVFAGTNPFNINTIGTIAYVGELNLTTENFRSVNANFSTTYLFAVDPSYFETYNLFQTTANITAIFEQNEVLISNTLMDELLISTGDNISLSVVQSMINREARKLEITPIKELNLTIGGTTIFDSGIFDDASDAFKPESTETSTFSLRFFSQVSNCIVMSYSTYMEVFENDTAAISFNGVQLKLDHSKLSTDPTTLLNQIAKITGVVEVYYPDVVIVDLLAETVNAVADQLNQMRLFLIYFALPGLLLGGYISKYAIDLTIEERQREIGILRTRAAKRKQIVLSIAYESVIISVIGLIIGLAAGFVASLTISNLLNPGNGLIKVSIESTVMSVGIGLIIVLLAIILSIRQLLRPSVTETIKNGKDTSVPLWKRIYLDILMLAIVIIIAILNILDFNPIPGFATAIYDFVAPLLTWLGLTLLMVRFLEKILISLEEPITKINSFLFKDLSPIITKNILHRPQRISKITIVLSLTLSFGMVIAIISDTYVQGAYQDAAYQVGSDIRIQFPTSDYLDFNTSDFISDLENQFSNEIESSTAIYTTSIRIGRSSIIIIGVEPESFFATATVSSSFFQSGSLESAMYSLMQPDTNGIYSNVILSETITNPSTTSSSTGSKGGRMGGLSGTTTTEEQLFEIGSVLPLRIGVNVTAEIQIGDIATHFPAIADLTGRTEEDIQYAICNVEFLKQPVIDSNTTLLSNENASFMLLNVNDNYQVDQVSVAISQWFEDDFTSESTLSITTTEMMLDDYMPLINSLIGLTNLEFLLVLAISTFGLEIFLTSSLYKRKKEFGTYYAIGAPVNDVRKLIIGELLLISGFSIVTGILLSGLVSFMYLGFISDLLILEIYSLTIPFMSILGLVLLVIISMIIAMALSGNRLAKLDPANILRTV